MNNIKDITRIGLIFIVIGSAIARLYVVRLMKQMGHNKAQMINS